MELIVVDAGVIETGAAFLPMIAAVAFSLQHGPVQQPLPRRQGRSLGARALATKTGAPL
jgi:hypothetical protein